MNRSKFWVSAFLFTAFTPAAFGADCPHFRNDDGDKVGVICDRDNADDSVIVMIAGLGGSGTWKQLRQYINDDSDLASYDVLEYHTPKSMRIEQHFDYVAGEVNKRWPDLKNLVIVGHSIGGIVVRTLAIENPANRTFPVEPQFVVTYATPFEEERFYKSWWQSFVSRFAFLIGAVQPLHKDAFDEAKIARYAKRWRTSIERDEDGIADRYLAIYGLSDKTAPAKNELDSPFVVLIEGTHKNVVKPRRNNTCPFDVLKHMIVTSRHGPHNCLLR